MSNDEKMEIRVMFDKLSDKQREQLLRGFRADRSRIKDRPKDCLYYCGVSVELLEEELKKEDQIAAVKEAMRNAPPMPLMPGGITLPGSSPVLRYPEEVFKADGKALDIGDILYALKHVKSKMFVLNLPLGMPDNLREQRLDTLKDFWRTYDIKTPVLILPDRVTLLGCEEFGFSIAIRVLEQGFKVQRRGWDGYLYMEKGVIYHSNDKKEWKPTQKALLAYNWLLYS